MGRRSTQGRRAAGGGRGSGPRKVEVILRLLRGEDLDLVPREVGVTAATLASWREAFLGAGVAGCKSRKGDPLFEENARFKSKVGELTMEIEPLYEKIDRLVAGFNPSQRGRGNEPGLPALRSKILRPGPSLPDLEGASLHRLLGERQRAEKPRAASQKGRSLGRQLGRGTLVERISKVLKESPWNGEGTRKSGAD